MEKVLPGLEPGLKESESLVMTITLQDLVPTTPLDFKWGKNKK